MFRFHYLVDAPLLSVETHPQLGGNINGPSLIKTPDWVKNPLARYLLYFAHHEGDSIRLAISDDLKGPWRIHHPPPLSLDHSRFPSTAPTYQDLLPSVQASIDAGEDGNYPHIASPDVWVDHAQKQIRLYYHGRNPDGSQSTRVALSNDGLSFAAQEESLGNSYFRIFQYGDWFYGLAMPAMLYRSRNGLNQFLHSHSLTDEHIRHHALLSFKDRWFLFWTRVGDQPEAILVSEIDTSKDWKHWKLLETQLVHKAEKIWEGADHEPFPSRYGGVMHPVNQLRDPAIYLENGEIYLLYAIAGEQGIAIGRLEADPDL